MTRLYSFRVWIISACLLMTFSFTGCWDVEEINRRNTANSLFLDQGQNNPVKLGISIEVPGSLLPAYNGTEQLFQKRNYIISGEGRGLLDAWKVLQTNTARSIYFGQIGAVILSDKFAKVGLTDLLDFLGRWVEIPGNTYILVTCSDPEQLLDLKLRNNFLPGNYIQTYYESPSRKSLAIPIRLWQIFTIVANRTSDIFMPLIEPSQGQYKIAGLALFSRERMVGTLDVEETEALALVKEVQNGYLTVPLGRTGDNRLVAFYNIKSNSKIQPVLSSSGQLQFIVKVLIAGSIQELQPRDVKITPAEIRRYQKAASLMVKKEITKVLTKLQKYNSDVVGFGGKLRIKYPRYWESIDWHQEFPKVGFKVETRFTSENTGVFR